MPEGFRNPVAAGRDLILDALQSKGFLTGSTGWRIGRDGSAEFNTLTARGDVTVGSKATSVAKAVTSYGASGFTARVNESNSTTTATRAQASNGSGLSMYSDVGLGVAGWADVPDAAIVDTVLTVHFDFASTSASGSGGHFQAYYTDFTNTESPYMFEFRSGQDDGQKYGSMVWADSPTKAQLNALTGGQTRGQIAIRHTGSTAYLLKWMALSIHWKVRLT